MPVAFYWTAGAIAVLAAGFFVVRFFWRMNAVLQDVSETLTQLRIAMDARRGAQGGERSDDDDDDKPVDFEHRKYF